MSYLLADIAEIMIGHTTKGAIVDDPLGDTMLVQAKDIGKEGNINLVNLPKIILGESRSKAYLQKSDVLLSSRGSFRSALWGNSDLNALATASIYVIRLRTQRISPEFLVLYFNSSIGQTALQKCALGASISALPKSNLIGLEIPVPSVKSQELAVSIQRNWTEQRKLLQEKQSLSQEIIDTLFKKLLTQAL